ncbi:MAG: hypothetical protein M1832_003749 [Thelocarpon impressellum]|nr:MAG: hypothetical protein M1832_003749 [Thelocarpon impressellum]
MSAPKVVVVFGATGQQGGSVVKSILADPVASQQFKIRGITRDPSKPNAQALAAKGVECVTGDLNSKESLKEALKGAFAVFAVTNYWEKMSKDVEEEQGRNVADVSKELGIQHLIWSSLLNISDLTNGKFSGVYHFDSKANVEEYIRSIGVPATFFMPGFYMSNISLRPNPESEAHEYIFAMPFAPDTPIPLFDPGEDTGKFVKAILLNREGLLGKRVYATTAYYTPEEIVEDFKKLKPVSGKGAHFVELSPEKFTGALAKAGLPEKAQVELLENMQFLHDFGYYGKAGLEESHAILSEKPTTLREFLAKQPQYQALE